MTTRSRARELQRLTRRALAAVLSIVFAAQLTTAVAQDIKILDANLVAIFVMRDSRIVTSGTGFAIGARGHVATATHLAIHRGAAIRVVRAGFPMDDPSKGLTASIIQADETTHIALLKVEGLGMSGLRFRSSPLVAGMQVVAVGYPRLQGTFDQTINRLMVSARIQTTKAENPGGSSHSLIHYLADADPGSMGGPILDTCGNAAGITVLGYSLSLVRQAASAADLLAAAKAHGLEVSIDAGCSD